MHRDSKLATTVEGEGPRQRSAPTFEEIQRGREVEEEARKERLEDTRVFASQIELLALDPDPEVGNPVLDSLSNILPVILKRKYGIQASLKDLVEAGHTLRQAQEARKKLREKEIQLDKLLMKNEVERLEIKGEWEKIRAGRALDPEKKALREDVKKSLEKERILTDRLNEIYADYKNFRILFVSLLGATTQCDGCRQRFVQNLKPYGDAQEWLASGKWSLLSYETINVPS